MDNMDKIVEMCRLAVLDIIASVGGVQNLLSDDGRMALIQAIAQRLEQLGADVDAVLGTELANAYMQGITDGDAFLSSQGVDTTVTGFNKQIHLSGVEQIVADAMTDMSASFRTALIMGIQDIDGILQSVNQDIAKGMILGNPSDTVARAVEQTFARNGMTAFVTKDGKRLPLDFYSQTVVRTKYRVAHTTGATNRYKESGVYHIKISEHHPTCQVCARYQGMVVALDEENADGFPIADQDVPLPPYHPNCQHTARPFVMDYHSQADIKKEKRKWNQFDPDTDPRTDAQKNLYKNEQDIRRKARNEMKEYELMKATLKGDDLEKLPKTLGAYRRLKRKDDEQWKALQTAYKSNMDIVNGVGPGPGTPRKKRGSKTGSTVQINQTGNTQDAVSSAQNVIDDAVDTSDMSTKSRYNTTLDDADQKAHERFDQVIDGIEYVDRRKTSQNILKSIPGQNMKVRVAKISANGHCDKITVTGGKINIGEFALRSNENRPEQYQWKTMYHEFYHANLQGLEYKKGKMFNKEWTTWEETATECSAFFMMDRGGWDTSTITPSYAEYLADTLPVLKTLPEFADCENMVDFGAKFMKYRFDPDHATADWTWLEQKTKSTHFNQNEYFDKHYKAHLEQNIDRFTEMAIDGLQQDKTYVEGLRSMIRSGLETGIRTGKVNREVRMILPVLYNEIGVKGI